MKAAFGKFDYTPPPGVRFGRLGVNISIADGVVWPLHARMALFEDADTIAAVIALDLGLLFPTVVADFRRAISERMGIPPPNIFVACTHTHNAPPTNPWLANDAGFEFADRLCARLADLAAQLKDALQPVSLRVGRARAPGWSANRRPIYRVADGGEQVGTHGPRAGENFLRMEGPDEEDLLAALAIGADGRPMGGFVNFACHPTCLYNDSAFSADYPGPLLDALERRYGGTFLFLTGAAGDLSPMRDEHRFATAREQTRAMGEALAQKAIEAIQAGHAVPSRGIRVQYELLSVAQRRVTGPQVEVAREYLEAAKQGTWGKSLPRELYGCEYHFYHPGANVDDWLAREILGMWEWQRRVATRELIETVEISVVSLDQVALVGLPCELFSAFGHRIRSESPFADTLVVELANGWHGYVPTQEGFSRGGYETCLAMQSRLAPDAGERMTEAALRLLQAVEAKSA